MRGVIERHGGTVEKFIGDAVMAVFGVPVLHEDDVVRAARAALEMRTALDDLNGDLGRRRGTSGSSPTRAMNTGEIAVSTTPEGEPFTLGDPVNVAQRLESAAGPGEILIGPITERLLRGSARLERVEPMRLKGKTDLVAAWRLVALDPVRRRRRAQLARRPRGRARRAARRVRRRDRDPDARDRHVDRRRRHRQVAARARADAARSRRARRSRSAAARPTARASHTGRWPRSSARCPSASTRRRSRG